MRHPFPAHDGGHEGRQRFVHGFPREAANHWAVSIKSPIETLLGAPRSFYTLCGNIKGMDTRPVVRLEHFHKYTIKTSKNTCVSPTGARFGVVLTPARLDQARAGDDLHGKFSLSGVGAVSANAVKV